MYFSTTKEPWFIIQQEDYYLLFNGGKLSRALDNEELEKFLTRHPHMKVDGTLESAFRSTDRYLTPIETFDQITVSDVMKFIRGGGTVKLTYTLDYFIFILEESNTYWVIFPIYGIKMKISNPMEYLETAPFNREYTVKEIFSVPIGYLQFQDYIEVNSFELRCGELYLR